MSISIKRSTNLPEVANSLIFGTEFLYAFTPSDFGISSERAHPLLKIRKALIL
jgi:hypothetical protein